jgi:hypothetical protein
VEEEESSSSSVSEFAEGGRLVSGDWVDSAEVGEGVEVLDCTADGSIWSLARV